MERRIKTERESFSPIGLFLEDSIFLLKNCSVEFGLIVSSYMNSKR